MDKKELLIKIANKLLIKSLSLKSSKLKLNISVAVYTYDICLNIDIYLNDKFVDYVIFMTELHNTKEFLAKYFYLLKLIRKNTIDINSIKYNPILKELYE